MTESTVSYEEVLYPFQNRILKTVEELSMPFYLTGGTALSRFYFGHRYSDDLDFFVNDDENFAEHVNLLVGKLLQEKFEIAPGSVINSVDTGFFQAVFVEPGTEAAIKVDMVNDIPSHFGNLSVFPEFSRVDSVRNILTNKLSALIGRDEIKDIVDLREICGHYGFSWSEVLSEAMEKEANLDPDFISCKLEIVKERHLDDIKWIRRPSFAEFRKDLHTIVQDMMNLSDNTLCMGARGSSLRMQRAVLVRKMEQHFRSDGKNRTR